MALSKRGYSAKFDFNIPSTLSSGYRSVIRSYTLSQFTIFFTDRILEAVAPSLVNLEYLNLTGCHNVTHHGVWAILSSSTNGLLGLALEGIYHKFVS